MIMMMEKNHADFKTPILITNLLQFSLN